MEQQWTLRLKSVEGRSQDLNFVNGQTSDQIRALEAENTSLRQQLTKAIEGDIQNTRVLDGNQKKVKFFPNTYR